MIDSTVWEQERCLRAEVRSMQAVATLADHAQEGNISRGVHSEGRGATHSPYVLGKSQFRWINSDLTRQRFISNGESARANVSHEI